MAVWKWLSGRAALAVSLVCVVVCGLLACSSGRQMTIQDIPVPKQPVFLVQDEKAFFDSFDRALGFSGEFSKPFRRNGDDDGAVDGVWVGQLRRQARSGDAASCYWLGRFLV